MQLLSREASGGRCVQAGTAGDRRYQASTGIKRDRQQGSAAAARQLGPLGPPAENSALLMVLVPHRKVPSLTWLNTLQQGQADGRAGRQGGRH